jgi:uncharacterized protein YjiS (DUF1127 family)
MEIIVSMNWTVPFSAQTKVGDQCLRRVIASAGGLWGAYRRWRAEQRAIDQLSAMSDRELQDIGLIRSEIDSAVMISPSAAAPWGNHETPRTKWRGR